jgi:tripeptide aminopeptidase
VSRVLDTFLELVRIASPSGAEAACGRYVAAALAASGMAVGFDDTAAVTGSDTGNLIAVLPATVPGRRVVLSAHLDTVQPGIGIEPVVEDGVVRPAGETVLGGDDKCGIAAILEGVRRIVEGDVPHAEVTVVMTTNEEIGLRGAKALDPAVVAGADLAVVLDAAGRPGGIAARSDIAIERIDPSTSRPSLTKPRTYKGLASMTCIWLKKAPFSLSP